MIGFVMLSACHGPAESGSTLPSQAAAELTPALVPLAWWLGDWDAEDGKGSEHWVAAAGAIYGVSLRGNTFEVMVIDDGDGPGAPDGVLRFYAMPGGARSIEFGPREIADTAASFANDKNDFPKTIMYQGTPDRAGLVAMRGGGDTSVAFRWTRGTSKPAPELEAADRAFAEATARRGADGWIAAFDLEGGMITKAGRVEHAAIAALMQPMLAGGRLAWAPIASGQAGALGYTVGKATYTGATPAAGWRTSYVTIWRRQADGAWKVLFDTGRLVQDL
jgi:ketosteroid isomerase-like protein